jgi:hypothetical protein
VASEEKRNLALGADECQVEDSRTKSANSAREPYTKKGLAGAPPLAN